MTSIGASPRADLRAYVDPEFRRERPHTIDVVERDAAIHDRLVRDAHAQLGSPGDRPLATWSPAGPPTIASPNLDQIPVALGTSVTLSGADEPDTTQRRNSAAGKRPPGGDLRRADWTVIGAGDSDLLHLQRRLPDGTVQHQQERWAALLQRNPELVPQSWIMSGGPYFLGDDERLARLRPVPTFPTDAERAARLVDAAAPISRTVQGAEGHSMLGANLLVGADRLDPGHPATPSAVELDRIAAWMHERGAPTWHGSGGVVHVITGVRELLGNARVPGEAAAAGAAAIEAGPRDLDVVRELLADRDVVDPTSVLDMETRLRAKWPAVLAHEAGHVATGRLWGQDHQERLLRARRTGDNVEYSRLTEHRVAGEAYSDLFGAAYARTDDVGPRKLGAIDDRFTDLPTLRATIAGSNLGFDEHVGTQLLTKPMLEVRRLHGWDAVGDVTASAARQLGAMIDRGDIDAVDLPHAATALRDAAAGRWGANSEVVQALTGAWTKLRVLV